MIEINNTIKNLYSANTVKNNAKNDENFSELFSTVSASQIHAIIFIIVGVFCFLCMCFRLNNVNDDYEERITSELLRQYINNLENNEDSEDFESGENI